ncbi:MAG: hypothetical protein EOP04_07470 [Proteobacteria bacterium]|nr:MAG: hypothetical protein EOP04_07470 [Pseudomonadota bacterium]
MSVQTSVSIKEASNDLQKEISEWIHDSELLEISLPTPDSKELKLKFRSGKGDEHRLKFSNVLALSCSSISTQNVVFEMNFLVGQDAVDELSIIFSDINALYSAKLIDSLVRGDLRFVQIQPSVGAQFSIIFEKLSSETYL